MTQVLTEIFQEEAFGDINDSREYCNDDLEVIADHRRTGYFSVETGDTYKPEQTFYVAHTPVLGSDRVRIVFSPWSEDPKRAMDEMRNDAEVAATGISTIRVSNPGTHPTFNPINAAKTRITPTQRNDVYGHGIEHLDDFTIPGSMKSIVEAQHAAIDAAINSWYGQSANAYLDSKELIGSGSSLGGLLLAGSLDQFDYDVLLFHNTVNPNKKMSKAGFMRKIAPATARGDDRYKAENAQAGLAVADDKVWRLGTTFMSLTGVYLHAMAHPTLGHDLHYSSLHTKNLRVVLAHGDDVVSSPEDNAYLARYMAEKGLKVADITRTGSEHTQANSVVRHGHVIRHALETADRL